MKLVSTSYGLGTEGHVLSRSYCITNGVLYIILGALNSPQNKVFFILALLRSKDQDGNFTAVTSSSSSSIGDLFTYILYDFPFNDISNKTTSICKVSIY